MHVLSKLQFKYDKQIFKALAGFALCSPFLPSPQEWEGIKPLSLLQNSIFSLRKPRKTSEKVTSNFIWLCSNSVLFLALSSHLALKSHPSKAFPSLFTELNTYHETVKLLEEYLHLSHQLPLQLDKEEWKLGA